MLTSHHVLVFVLAASGHCLLLVGSGLYLVGNFVATMTFNVPRNETLTRIDPLRSDNVPAWTGQTKLARSGQGIAGGFGRESRDKYKREGCGANYVELPDWA